MVSWRLCKIDFDFLHFFMIFFSSSHKYGLMVGQWFWGRKHLWNSLTTRKESDLPFLLIFEPWIICGMPNAPQVVNWSFAHVVMIPQDKGRKMTSLIFWLSKSFQESSLLHARSDALQALTSWPNFLSPSSLTPGHFCSRTFAFSFLCESSCKCVYTMGTKLVILVFC